MADLNRVISQPVACWLDGGLFDLPTAAVFWILLELGTSVSTVEFGAKSLILGWC
jgi:hypothetical protein